MQSSTDCNSLRTSSGMRSNPNFLRNSVRVGGRFEIAKVNCCEPGIILGSHGLVGYERCNAISAPFAKTIGVHFSDCPEFTRKIYANCQYAIDKIMPFAYAVTPRPLLFERSRWQVLKAVGESRWIDAMWQQAGINVIPLLFWGDDKTLEFCFDGVEIGGAIAIDYWLLPDNQFEREAGFMKLTAALKPSLIVSIGRATVQIPREIKVVNAEVKGKQCELPLNSYNSVCMCAESVSNDGMTYVNNANFIKNAIYV